MPCIGGTPIGSGLPNGFPPNELPPNGLPFPPNGLPFPPNGLPPNGLPAGCSFTVFSSSIWSADSFSMLSFFVRTSSTFSAADVASVSDSTDSDCSGISFTVLISSISSGLFPSVSASAT